MTFADNLVYLRQHYGITQEGLAEQLGVSRQTVSKWEAGTNYPEMDKLLVLCDLFHTNLDDLMRGSVQVTNDNDTERYDRHMNRFDLSIALGVACILVGVGVQVLLDALGWPSNISTVAFLSFVVGGILCGIVYLAGSVLFKTQDDWIAEARQEDAWMKYAQSGAEEDPWARGPEQPTDGRPDSVPTQAAAPEASAAFRNESPRPSSAPRSRSTWK